MLPAFPLQTLRLGLPTRCCASTWGSDRIACERAQYRHDPDPGFLTYA
ncbi:MAG: hypothetical protein M3Q40_04630 [Pseudomonadota bacterium]|nr:hypothetical protein [Pseudomonadota bacterium]